MFQIYWRRAVGVRGGNISRLGRLMLIAAALSVMSLDAGRAEPEATKAEQAFLDKLMMAESGGRQFAKNPKSSALGPFQFIRSTFLEVALRYFPELTEGKSDAEILALRVDPKVARNAALAYTRENAAFLHERGVVAEPAHLRLAFLVGPNGAIKVIAAKPETLVSALLSATALEANPFLEGMTAKQLMDRSAREAAGLAALPVVARRGAKGERAGPQIRVRCNLGRASCRRWLALAKQRAASKAARRGKKTAAQDTQ